MSVAHAYCVLFPVNHDPWRDVDFKLAQVEWFWSLFQNCSKELYDKRHYVSLMLTLFLYSSSLTNLQKSQWQLANNIHVTLLLILTNPTTSSNNSYFYEDEDKETLSRLSWSASNHAHCSYIYSECHVLRYHYLWHLNEVDKFSNKAVLSANWPCVQALRMRISERVRFFQSPAFPSWPAAEKTFLRYTISPRRPLLE